jgi:hypothetical protein
VAATRTELDERFAGADLDREVWLPSYLPHWSSRAASAATYQVRDGELRLSIPPHQPLWCPDRHPSPLRVSGVQSGNLTGSQPFQPGLAVAEEQPAFLGYTPRYGHVEIRMRGVVTPRSMFAFWPRRVRPCPGPPARRRHRRRAELGDPERAGRPTGLSAHPSRSTIMALAMPPPSHMVCSP